MRYTEIRMSKLAHSLLADLEKETVDFVENYDGTEHINTVSAVSNIKSETISITSGFQTKNSSDLERAPGAGRPIDCRIVFRLEPNS